MVQYIFTPWRDRRELLAVRQQFYAHPLPPPSSLQQTLPNTVAATTTTSRNRHTPTGGRQIGLGDAHEDGSTSSSSREREEREEKQKAVARVSMWMQRGGCPHMVESTALLTAAILSDEGGWIGSGSGSRGGNGGPEEEGAARASRGYAVRAAYSAAFSRFVTGLLDSHQDKQRKMSMYDVAKSVGLPATFVELRHQATHEQLPSLTRLRAAARNALAWIWEYYWRHLQMDGVAGHQVADKGTAVAAIEGSGSEEEGEGDGSEDEREARRLVLRYLKEEEREDLRRAIGRVDEGLVLTVLDSISGSTKDSRVLRRAMALTREILEGGGDVDRMEEDEKSGEDQDAQDVEKVRIELGKAWENVKEADQPSIAEGEDAPAKVEMVKTRPAWRLYEEEAWVPKPIGVV